MTFFKMVPAASPIVRVIAAGDGNGKRRTAPLSLVSLLVCLCAAAEGQGVDRRLDDPPDPRPPQLEKRDSTDVYINDSFEASDAIARAKRLATAGRWDESAELLHRTAAVEGSKLVPLEPGVFTGIRRRVADLISRWPQSGIDAYRWLYEREMENALAALAGSRRVDDLLELFELYFCTARAGELADTIGQLAIESGDFALAQRVYLRVLEAHPDRERFMRRYGNMLTLVQSMVTSDRDALPATIRPEGTIRWMGSERSIDEVASGLDGSWSQSEIGKGVWPTFGGQPDRNRRVPSSVDELGLLWRFAQFTSSALSDTDSEAGQSRHASRQNQRRLTMHPVLHEGLVIVQNWREIVALHKNTGILAWKYGADEVPPARFSDFEEIPSGWDSVTVHDGLLYAALPGDVVPYYGYETAQSLPEVVCLDARSGAERWRLNRESAGDALAEISFDSSPIVGYGKVFIVGRRRRSFGFEDCYLYVLSASNGAIISRTHLGSASTGSFGSRQPTVSIAAMHGGTVFICTNLGSVGAVSAHTGAVRWLRLYERSRVQPGNEAGWSVRDIKPWYFNPVIYDNGHIVILPVDARHLHVIDAANGKLLQSVPVTAIGNMTTLLGVDGDLICGVGDHLTCYNWKKRTVERSIALPEDDMIYGRGVWVKERSLIPLRDGMFSFHAESSVGSLDHWEQQGRGGNILALEDVLIVAGVDGIAAYVRKADLWRDLHDRMDADPDDPVPALELAEVALRGGERTKALTALNASIERAGSFQTPLSPDFQKRLFDDILMFVDELDAHNELTPELLGDLFGFAAQCPPDAKGALKYRLRFAELFASKEQIPRAIRLYQQVLQDRSLRELTGESSESAGQLARRRIARLIENHGIGVYAEVEAEARQRLQRARAAGDAGRLAELEAVFPNSKAAREALIARGDLMLRQKRFDEAATLFSQAYHRYFGRIDSPALIKRIADAFEKSGRAPLAYRWLTKGAREHPNATIEHNGRKLSILEYRSRLEAYAAASSTARPTVGLPLAVSKAAHPPVGELLVPRFSNEVDSNWSRYFVYAGDGIHCFTASSTQTVWTQPAPVRAVPELLLANADSALFATAFEVFWLDASTGSRLWSHGRYPPAFNPNEDWEGGDGYRAHARRGNRLVSIRESGDAVCLDLTGGGVLWETPLETTPIGRIHLSDSWLAYHIVSDGVTSIHVLDANSGQPMRMMKLEEQRSVEDLYLGLDGRIIVITSRSIASYDPESSQPMWRVQLDGHLRTSSLLADFDALYFSDDGRHLSKLALEDGRELWRTVSLADRGDEGIAVQRQGGNVIVGTYGAVAAVDDVTGLTLWRGTAPEPARFLGRFVTTAFLAAIHVPNQQEEKATAFFYDHRNASGLIHRNGGALDLGVLSDVRNMLVVDGALVVQDGTTIRRWNSASFAQEPTGQEP